LVIAFYVKKLLKVFFTNETYVLVPIN